MDRHYHPLVFTRLKALFASEDWDGLQAYLESLSNAHFRTAGYMIGERLLADVSQEVFWHVALRLILWQPKAFVVTMAKAAAARIKAGSLSFRDSGFEALALALKDASHLLDRQKLLAVWLPVVSDYEIMESLFDSLGFVEPRRRVDFLMHTAGVTSAFVLLRTLRYEEHDRDYLTAVCKELIKRAANKSGVNEAEDSLSYNMASLLRTYFDLPDVRGTFSLALEAYELTNIDTDFDIFKRVVTKV